MWYLNKNIQVIKKNQINRESDHALQIEGLIKKNQINRESDHALQIEGLMF